MDVPVPRWPQNRYLLIDTTKNELVAVDVDLEEFAKRIGLMEPWERLAE